MTEGMDENLPSLEAGGGGRNTRLRKTLGGRAGKLISVEVEEEYERGIVIVLAERNGP